MKIKKLDQDQIEQLTKNHGEPTPKPKNKPPVFGWNPNTTTPEQAAQYQRDIDNKLKDAQTPLNSYLWKRDENGDIIRRTLPLPPKYNGVEIDLDMLLGVADNASRYVLDTAAMIASFQIGQADAKALETVKGRLVHLAIYIKTKKELDEEYKKSETT